MRELDGYARGENKMPGSLKKKIFKKKTISLKLPRVDFFLSFTLSLLPAFVGSHAPNILITIVLLLCTLTLTLFPSSPPPSKTVRAKHKGALHLVKVFVKQDPLVNMEEYKRDIENTRCESESESGRESKRETK